jgi:hypothetical protein
MGRARERWEMLTDFLLESLNSQDVGVDGRIILK